MHVCVFVLKTDINGLLTRKAALRCAAHSLMCTSDFPLVMCLAFNRPHVSHAYVHGTPGCAPVCLVLKLVMQLPQRGIRANRYVLVKVWCGVFC